MSKWSEIRYREFWDVPRAVIARHGADTFFFDSRFDEVQDGYLDHYEVWRLPALSEQQLRGSWVGLELLAIEQLASIGLRELPFEIPPRNGPDPDAATPK